MAARKKSGTAWYGLILGMVLGVAAAVGVALFVTQAPMPFKDKASRSTPATLLPDVGNAPDPNIALYGKDGPAGTRPIAQGGGTDNPPAPAPEPGAPAENPLSDAIGQIIASLDPPKPGTRPATPAAAPTAKAPASATSAASAAPASLTPPPPPLSAPASQPPAGTQTTYYLQTGAFRSMDEAQAMLARVVMLGLPVRIESTDAKGSPINRVRVGPFKGIDEMNRARTKLGDEKIPSNVVRP